MGISVLGKNLVHEKPSNNQVMQGICPICGKMTPLNARYPDAVCSDCIILAVDETNRPLSFFNEELGGGFSAIVNETNELRKSHICYIQGLKCWADEAYMGGIVIVPINKDHE